MYLQHKPVADSSSQINVKHTQLSVFQQYNHNCCDRVSVRLLKEVTRAAIIWSKNTVKSVRLWNIIVISNSCFLCEYLFKCNLFLWSKLYFQHHYSSLQCHMICSCCSRDISDYYQCWKQFSWQIFLWKLMHFIVQDSQKNRKFKRTAFIRNINLF